jgi:hypothetical protein
MKSVNHARSGAVDALSVWRLRVRQSFRNEECPNRADFYQLRRPFSSAVFVGRFRRPFSSAVFVGRFRRPFSSAIFVGRFRRPFSSAVFVGRFRRPQMSD